VTIEVRAVSWSKPLPALDPVSLEFWSAAAEGRLLVQYCPGCGRYQHYPRRLCLSCGSEPRWEEASGRGTIYTFTVIRQNGASGFRDETPYVVAMIELEEGARMMGNLTGCPVEEVFVGMPVCAYAISAEEGVGIVQWEPVRP
jgi:uncharacterized protein